MVKKNAKKILSIILLAVLLLSIMPVSYAAEGESGEEEFKREIAVVYDNSGSMYVSFGIYRWCKSVYACEVFSAMMNDCDELLVYPMNPVTVGKNEYSSSEPLPIHVGEEGKLSNMITRGGSSGNTPVEAVDQAYYGLLKSDADEKWLVMLTDGDVFYEDGKEQPGSGTRDLLSQRLSKYNNEVNVLYMAVDCSEEMLPAVRGRMLSYSVAIKGDMLLKTVVNMANLVFNRYELETDGKKISFDIPVKKMIIFAQGENLNMVKVPGLGTKIRQYYPQYSVNSLEISEPFSEEAPYWAIVTYAECAPGDYQLEHSGTLSNYAVFFEPDVDVISEITGNSGSGELIATLERKSGTISSRYFNNEKYSGKTDDSKDFTAKFVAWHSDNPTYGNGGAPGGIEDDEDTQAGPNSGGKSGTVSSEGSDDRSPEGAADEDYEEEEEYGGNAALSSNPDNFRVNRFGSGKNKKADNSTGSSSGSPEEIYKRSSVSGGGTKLPNWFNIPLYIILATLMVMLSAVVVATIKNRKK